MNPDAGLPACPRCGSPRVVRAEDESGHRSRMTLPLVLATAVCLLLIYFAFLVYAYLAYPLTVILFAGASGWWISRREKRRRKTPEKAVRLYCDRCGAYFDGSGGGVPGSPPPTA